VEEVKKQLLLKLKEYRKGEETPDVNNDYKLQEIIEKLRMQVFAHEEENKILEKENSKIKQEMTQMEINSRMLEAELQQEKRNMDRKESYFPVMIRLSEEDANNRISRLARENVKRETELEKKIVDLRERIEEQAVMISKMKQAERDLFLSISKFGKVFTIPAPSNIVEGDEEIKEIEPMIRNAIDHNHSREQIKISLLNSGYKKENIEKVLNHYP